MLVLPLRHLHNGGLVAIIPSALGVITEGASDDILPHGRGNIA